MRKTEGIYDGDGSKLLAISHIFREKLLTAGLLCGGDDQSIPIADLILAVQGNRRVYQRTIDCNKRYRPQNAEDRACSLD